MATLVQMAGDSGQARVNIGAPTSTLFLQALFAPLSEFSFTKPLLTRPDTSKFSQGRLCADIDARTLLTVQAVG